MGRTAQSYIRYRQQSDYLADEPTNAIPRSPEMIAVMQERLKQRVPLKNPRDCPQADFISVGVNKDGKVVRTIGYEDLTEAHANNQTRTQARPIIEEVKSESATVLHIEKNFGFWLRFFRKELHLSRTKLASLCGISVNAVKSYEYGSRSPQLSAIVSLAGAVGVTPKQLYMERTNG